MNLLVEYKKRRMSPIDIVGDSYFFIEGTPKIIIVISTTPKSLTLCNKCNSQTPELVVESISSFNPWSVKSHFHIKPDESIINKLVLNGICNSSHIPVAIKNKCEIESWLWNLFKTQSKINTKYENIFEDMYIFALNKPKMYTYFFSNFSNITFGRKYLLIA